MYNHGITTALCRGADTQHYQIGCNGARDHSNIMSHFLKVLKILILFDRPIPLRHNLWHVEQSPENYLCQSRINLAQPNPSQKCTYNQTDKRLTLIPYRCHSGAKISKMPLKTTELKLKTVLISKPRS